MEAHFTDARPDQVFGIIKVREPARPARIPYFQ